MPSTVPVIGTATTVEAATTNRFINHQTLSMYKGTTRQLKINGVSSGKVKWSSQNSHIAAVNSKGKVRAKLSLTIPVRNRAPAEQEPCFFFLCLMYFCALLFYALFFLYFVFSVLYYFYALCVSIVFTLLRSLTLHC